ncbi:MAG: hypothetical protein JRI63_05885, partial [Deltaproteobacteria bacterium]|nr:hypothetical protein [Deltaproteobacteria bacterium]
DAILLIVRILDPKQLKDYLDLSNDLQMDALVEIHSEKDIEKATRAGARLIGINNRNLRSFETDIHTSIRMKSLLEPDQVAVAASGIRSRKDIEKMNASGIWNFLIGESLVRADNPCTADNYMETASFLPTFHKIFKKKPCCLPIVLSQ